MTRMTSKDRNGDVGRCAQCGGHSAGLAQTDGNWLATGRQPLGPARADRDCASSSPGHWIGADHHRPAAPARLLDRGGNRRGGRDVHSGRGPDRANPRIIVARARLRCWPCCSLVLIFGQLGPWLGPVLGASTTGPRPIGATDLDLWLWTALGLVRCRVRIQPGHGREPDFYLRRLFPVMSQPKLTGSGGPSTFPRAPTPIPRASCGWTSLPWGLYAGPTSSTSMNSSAAARRPGEQRFHRRGGRAASTSDVARRRRRHLPATIRPPAPGWPPDVSALMPCAVAGTRRGPSTPRWSGYPGWPPSSAIGWVWRRGPVHDRGDTLIALPAPPAAPPSPAPSSPGDDPSGPPTDGAPTAPRISRCTEPRAVAVVRGPTRSMATTSGADQPTLLPGRTFGSTHRCSTTPRTWPACRSPSSGRTGRHPLRDPGGRPDRGSGQTSSSHRDCPVEERPLYGTCSAVRRRRCDAHHPTAGGAADHLSGESRPPVGGDRPRQNRR